MSTAQPASLAIQQIPIDQIVPSPYQARRTFDEANLQELAQSMKERTQLNPINVRPVGDHFELVAGERRWRAAKLLGWKTLKAIVEVMDDQEAAIRGLVENLQREDLNPIEEAEGFARLQSMDRKAWTQEAIGKTLGKGQSYVADALRLLQLPPEIKKSISREILSPSQGELFLRLSRSEDQVELAAQAVQGGWSVKETERRVNQLLCKPPKAGPKASEVKRTVREAMDQSAKDMGFQFAADGPRVVITAILDRVNGDIENFFAQLQTMLMLWISQHPYTGQEPVKIPDAPMAGTSPGSAEEPSEAEQIRMAEEIIAKFGRIV